MKASSWVRTSGLVPWPVSAEIRKMSGVPVSRYVWGAMVVSALMAGVAAIVLASKVGVYSNTYGTGQLFPALSALFFGATQVKGRLNVWGTLIALYVLA